MDNQQGLTVQHKVLCSGLRGSLDGRGVWGRMDTFPSCCSPETIMTLLICYTTIQNKKFKRKIEQHSVFILEHALVLFAYFWVVMCLSPAGMWPSLFWAGGSHASFLFSRCTKSRKDGQAGGGAVVMTVKKLGGLGGNCPRVWILTKFGRYFMDCIIIKH